MNDLFPGKKFRNYSVVRKTGGGESFIAYWFRRKDEESRFKTPSYPKSPLFQITNLKVRLSEINC